MKIPDEIVNQIQNAWYGNVVWCEDLGMTDDDVSRVVHAYDDWLRKSYKGVWRVAEY